MTEELHGLTIYGASDDLLEVEGYLREEFVAYTRATLILTAPNGACLAIVGEFDPVGHSPNVGDGWVLSVCHADPAWTYPIRLTSRPDRDTDPAVALDVPAGTTIEQWNVTEEPTA